MRCLVCQVEIICPSMPWEENGIRFIFFQGLKLCFSNKAYLCLRFVPNRFPAARIKWESGENPEQSRCCKPIMGQAYFSHCLSGDGKAPGPG